MSRIGLVIAFVLAAGCSLLSLYGWSFHFTAGPAHGPGAELGIFAGVGALLFAGIFIVILREERKG